VTRRGTARTLLAALAVLAGATALAGVASVEPAAARPQEPITIKAGDPVSKTFPGIPGNYPGSAAAYWLPNGCDSPADSYCDTVPLDIVRPDVDEATDWTVEISVTWNPTDTFENDAQDVQACDLDIWLFDDRQIEGRTSENPSYTQLDSSGLAVQPEVVSTYAPDLGRYNLVIVNFAGVNVDYTVTARIIIGHFEKPFEALGPTSNNTGGGSDEQVEESPPPDFSAHPSDAPPPLLNPELAPSPLGEVAVLPDQDFGAFEEASSFDEQLRRPELPPGSGLGNIRLRPPKDVPPAVLAFWFVLVPAALAAAAWVLIVRRRGQLVGSALSV
jgi:hypothetical protein